MLNFQCIWRGVTAKRNAIGEFVFLGNYIKIYHMLLFNLFSYRIINYLYFQITTKRLFDQTNATVN